MRKSGRWQLCVLFGLIFFVFMIQAAVAEAGGTSGGPADETLNVIYEGAVTLDDSKFT